MKCCEVKCALEKMVDAIKTLKIALHEMKHLSVSEQNEVRCEIAAHYSALRRLSNGTLNGERACQSHDLRNAA